VLTREWGDRRWAADGKEWSAGQVRCDETVGSGGGRFSGFG